MDKRVAKANLTKYLNKNGSTNCKHTQIRAKLKLKNI